MTYRSHGSGAPVTLIGHGLGATPGEARIPASGVRGTRVVVTLPGHGDEPDAPDDYWNYSRIAADLREVAREVGATRAIGVSLTAAALVALLAAEPDAFERVALLLPAVLDEPRPRLSRESMITSVDGPADYFEQRRWAFRRLDGALAALPGQVAVTDLSPLRRVVAPVLVVGAENDPLHPVTVAARTAAAFPNGRLEIVPSWPDARPSVRGWLADLVSDRPVPSPR
ncbi:alpha/beta fold hydrolase [Saccharothrix violaceirubra]|uniref:Pimeloyl-ACP methyl ester carboxylesterase n=1 Tax=Saccharothrix violaceirubra TaxID=413306 RepID=A0A7W7SXJ8_9PSEU|nr:alpha/beta hydrolase [Saccharothrix violaceirubra]MBB4962723.1 pimeloyl-ACP methyl ester carboxylesterase [Saccharothrix violaceirubra]